MAVGGGRGQCKDFLQDTTYLISQQSVKILKVLWPRDTRANLLKGGRRGVGAADADKGAWPTSLIRSVGGYPRERERNIRPALFSDFARRLPGCQAAGLPELRVQSLIC